MNLKTVAYLCSWPFSEFFLETKIFVWKFSVKERKHRISRGNVFSGLSKAHFKCWVQHFEKKMIKVNFTFCGLFRIVCVFFCSERKVSQEFQNHKLSVKRKNLGRIFLRQMLLQNIFSFWAEKLAVLAKNYRHGCQNCNLRTLKNFWGKTVFLKLNIIANFFGLRDEKKGLSVKKFCSGLLQQEFALTEKCFEQKNICLSKKFYFSVIRFGVWVISLSFFAKCFSQVCQTTDQHAERNKMGKLTWKNCFINQFWTLRKKTWFFSKTVRHESENGSLPVQLTIFRNFSGNKNICMKVFGHWTETSDFPRKRFLRAVKGAFQVFSATLWKKGW